MQATLIKQAEQERKRNTVDSVEDSEVDGEVKYVATALPEDSLHEDLQEIERELYLDRMGLTLGVSTTTGRSNTIRTCLLFALSLGTFC